MTDHTDRLIEIAAAEGGENAEAICWALDQIRWRNVREELPSEEAIYLVHADDWVAATWWLEEEERWVEISFEPTHWRPVSVPKPEPGGDDG